jgi:hypothetical protein
MFGQDASLERGKYLVEAYTLKAEETDATAYLKSLP